MVKKQLETSLKHITGRKKKRPILNEAIKSSLEIPGKGSKRLEKKRSDKPSKKKSGKKGKNHGHVALEVCDQIDVVKKDNATPQKPKKTHQSGEEDEHSGKKGKKPRRKVMESHEDKELIAEEGVLYLSSGEEDTSTGMGKWVKEYHESRVSLDVLQQRIDEFMIQYDKNKEAERKEAEEKAEEEGWTVVKRQKGNKKSKEEESGISVESASKAAAETQMSMKKPKELHNFYRFQKREAQMNDILTLQNKFEQDKMKIQQLRAARKFRPY